IPSAGKLRIRIAQRICFNEVGAVRDLIYVSSLAQVTRERADITNLHYCVVADVPLNAHLEVIDGWPLRIDLDGIYRTGRVQGSRKDAGQVFDTAEANSNR